MDHYQLIVWANWPYNDATFVEDLADASWVLSDGSAGGAASEGGINGEATPESGDGPDPDDGGDEVPDAAEGSSGGAGADPYVTPFHDDAMLKLPDVSECWRMLDGAGIAVNARTRVLPPRESRKLREQILGRARSTTGQRLVECLATLSRLGVALSDTPCFFDRLGVVAGGATVTVDMDTLRVESSHGPAALLALGWEFSGADARATTAHERLSPFAHSAVTRYLQIRTPATEAYGRVTLQLTTFDDPQVRNGFSMSTERAVPLDANGCMVSRNRMGIATSVTDTETMTPFRMPSTAPLEERMVAFDTAASLRTVRRVVAC